MAQEQQGERSMQARVGRDKQRYGPGGERLVAGVVPLSPDGTHVLLIQSSGRKGWVLPKGGWETDEGTQEEAARREAWEEAGIECDAAAVDLGDVEEGEREGETARRKQQQQQQQHQGGEDQYHHHNHDHRDHHHAHPLTPRAIYRFFEVRVAEEKDSWPERHKRDRRWMSYRAAREALADRPELLEALERSSIVKR